MFDLIIVGAGPSGLSAAIYSKRAGLSVAIFEGNNVGGQVSTAHIIENYPGFKSVSGFDLIMSMYDQVESLGAEFIYEKVNHIEKDGNIFKVNTLDGNTFESKAVILATGVIPRKLNLANEDKFIGKGISYCAICDGAFYQGKDVAIVGGGNSAAMEADYLAQYCNHIYVLQDLPFLTCDNASKEKILKNNKIEVLCNCRIKELLGNDKINGLTLTENEKEIHLDVAGVFVSIGKIPNNDEFKNITTLNELGYIEVDADLKGTVSGLFVAGDCRDKKIRQISTAVSDGAIAALNANTYLKSL